MVKSARYHWLYALFMIGSVICLLAVPHVTAQAHAVIVRSIPAAGAVLSESPKEVVLVFNEPIDPNLTRATLLDLNSQVIVEGLGKVDSENPNIFLLALPPLKPGTYTVRWLAHTPDDGHNTTGMVGFSIGSSSPPASLLPPVGSPDPATALPNPLDTFSRFVGYLFAAATAGALFFKVLIWSPAQANHAAESDIWLAGRIKKLAVIGCLGIICFSIGRFFVQAVQIGQSNLSWVLVQILLGRTGVILSARALVLVGIVFLIWPLPLGSPGDSIRWIVAACLMVGVLLTFSLQSHAAVSGSWPAISLDLVHLTAMTIWLGGLLPLTGLVMRYRSGPESYILPPVIRRFSWIALGCVILLAATGLFSAYQRIGTIQALISTTYGQAIIAKLCAFGMLLVIGALNLFYFVPKLRKDATSSVRWLSRSTRWELGLGIIVLLCVGVLTSSAPALDALAAQNRLGIIRTEKFGDYKVVLRIAPAVVGENEFGVDVYERHLQSELPLKVLLRFKLLDESLGTTQAETQHETGPRYTTHGSYISLVGRWQIEVILRRQGFNDQRLRFMIEMGDEPQVEGESFTPRNGYHANPSWFN